MKRVRLRCRPRRWLLILALGACSSQDEAQELQRWLEEVRTAAPAKAPPLHPATVSSASTSTQPLTRPALEAGLGRLCNPFAQDPL